MDNGKLHHICFSIIFCFLLACCSMPADKTSNLKVPPHYMPTGEQLDSAFTELYALRGIEGILDTNAAIVGNSEEMQMQYRQSVAKLDGMVRKIARQVKQYDDQPVYWVEIDRSGLHNMLLELNGIPLAYAYTGSHSEYRIDLLNQYIEADGEQQLRIRVYTTRGDFFRSRNNKPLIRIGYAADKRKGDDEPQYLTDYITLPDSIMDTGTQYWDTTITFHAQVPWDHTHRLQNAVDLRTLPDLEERVLRKYEDIRQFMVNSDLAGNFDENLRQRVYYFNSNYKYGYDVIKSNFSGFINDFNPNLEEKNIHPIDYYELALYRNGKIAHLRKRLDKWGVIRYTPIKPETELESDTYVFNYFLYLPEGETELQVY